MLVLYDSQEETFETLGIGVLTDFKTVPTVTEVLKGEYILEFEYLKKGKYSEYLNERNIIKALNQPFRIENIKPSKDGYRVLARHIVFDLRDNYLLDVSPTDKTAQAALNWCLERAEIPTNFTASGDCTETASARYVRLNFNEALWDADNSILNRFGGEPEYDKYSIILHSVRGSNTNIEIREKKNLSGFEMNIDLSTVKTRIQPIGRDGLILPEIFVDSPIIENYPTPKIGKLELDIGIDDDTTEQEAYTLMRNAVLKQYDLGLDKPTVSLKVDFIELSKTEEYKNFQNLETIHLGDRLRFFMPSINQNTQIRVIKTVKNALNGRIISLELGSEIPNIVTQQTINNREMRKQITTSALEAAKVEATELLKHPFNGHLFISESTGELYIADTDDLATATYIWKWGLGGLGFSKTGINGTFETAWTQDGKFVADFINAGTLNTNVIQGYDQLTITVGNNNRAIGDRTGKTTTITQDIASIEAQISDIADITTSANTVDGTIESEDLQNIAQSNPIKIEIHPTADNISYLYPRSNLYPSSNLFSTVRTIRFKNVTTNENFDYVLPDDLLYYDSTTYDSFLADAEERTVQITKRCGYNADGTVKVLDSPITTTYSFTELETTLSLTAGNYEVSLLGYSSGFIFVRMMVQNAYTAQYATRVELNSSIHQTAEEITLEVSINYVGNHEVISKINQTAEQITIDASKINIAGAITAINDNTTTTINGNKITTGTITANQLSANCINADKIAAGTITADKIANATITASKIVDASITGAKIADATITSAKINDINADKINAGTITAAAINLGNGKFSVNTNGYLQASSGTIGGWIINSSKLGGDNTYLNPNGSCQFYPSGGAIVGWNNAIRLKGPSGIAIYNSYTNYGGGSSIDSGIHLMADAGNLDLMQYSSSYGVNIRSYCSPSTKGNASARSIMLAAGNNITLAAVSGCVYAQGNGKSNSLVKTDAGSASSKNTKTNILKFEHDDYEESLNLLEKINIYSYDYKYKLYDKDHQYGFIIDEIEQQNNYDKFFDFNVYKAIINKDKTLDFDITSATKEDEIIEVKKYDSDVLDKYLLTVCKALLYRVEELERRNV